MGYSNVGTPVFYVDNYLYHKAIGTTLTEGIPANAYNMKPQITTPTTNEYPSNPFTIQLPVSPVNYNLSGNMNYYIAFLNHNIGANFQIYFDSTSYPPTEGDNLITGDFEDVLNGGDTGSEFSPLNGSTIITTNVAHDTLAYKLITNPISFNIGVVSTGIQYTMPTSPNLKLSMDIEMEGIKNTATLDGSSFSNIEYTGSPLWYNGGNYTNPFEIYYDIDYDVRQTGAIRHGRKKWDLKFSYISDKDLFAANMKSTYYSEHGTDGTMSNQYDSSDIAGSNDEFMHTIETDDSFVAQVWNKTLGGGLPFIFQPNSNNRDEFYICKFDQSSLQISQSAFNVYDISLKIEEVW